MVQNVGLAFIAIFGERRRDARFVVGCSNLPFDLAVEIEGLFEIE
jgi:hypothetical protein